MGIDDDDEAREKILGELPPLLAAVRAETPRARGRLERARPATETGKQLLALYLDTLERQRATAATLEQDLRGLGNGSVWKPLIDYGDQNEAERKWLGAPRAADPRGFPRNACTTGRP